MRVHIVAAFAVDGLYTERGRSGREVLPKRIMRVRDAGCGVCECCGGGGGRLALELEADMIEMEDGVDCLYRPRAC